MTTQNLDDLVFYNVELVLRNGVPVLKLTDKRDTTKSMILQDGQRIRVDGKSVTVDIIGKTQSTLNGTTGHDVLAGNADDNTINGNNGADSIFGFGGNDVIYGQGGDDYIIAGAGNDVVNGGDGADYIAGDNGNDILFGEAGDDSLPGGSGNDTIYGGAGLNFLYGDVGNDVLFVEAGANYAYGGSGLDTVNFSRFLFPSVGQSLYDYYGLVVYPNLKEGFDYQSFDASKKLTTGAFYGVETLIGSARNDVFRVDGLQSVNAGDGNDVIFITAETVPKEGMTVSGGPGDNIYRIDFNRNAELATTLVIKANAAGWDRLILADIDSCKMKAIGKDLFISVSARSKVSLIKIEDGVAAYNGTKGHLSILREIPQRGGAAPKIEALQPGTNNYLNKVDASPVSLVGGSGADLIANGTDCYEWFADSPLDGIYRNSLCTMTGGSGSDNFLLWSGGVITDFDYKKDGDTLVFAKEMFGSLNAVQNLKRTQRGDTLVLETPWKVPPGNPAVNQRITLQLVGVTEREFQSAIDNGHVRVQSLAGATVGSLGF